jgi:PST family polysaccharide transporter
LKPFDATGAFLPSRGGGGLRRHAVRGAGVTMIAQGVTFVIQMIATLVLARLLMPTDFGVVTMATTFSVLLVACGHVGIADAIIQRDEINQSLASNLFWINLGVALVLTAAFAAAGSLLAKFYGDLRLVHVAIGLSLTIFIDSTSVIHLSLLRRAMRFSVVSVNDIVARTVATVVSILLAWAGWGYWALIASAIAMPLSTTIGAWTLCRWVPSLPKRVAGTGAVVKYWVSVFGHYCTSYVTQNTDNFLVGWRFGSVALGVYKKAYDLFALPISLLNVFPVVVSTLSRLNKDHAQFRRYFLIGLSILALVGMGVSGEFTLVGKDLIRLMLGPHWDASGRIFMLFGPGIGAMLLYSTHSMIHLSVGTTGRYFRWGIIELAGTIMMFLLALPWGPAGIAAAWTVTYWVLTIPSLWYAGRPVNLGVASLLGAIWKFIVAALLGGCACFLIVRQFPFLVASPGALGAFYRIVANSVLFGALYLGAVVLLHGGWAPLSQFYGLLREVAPWEKFMKRSSAVSRENDLKIFPSPNS